MSMGVSAAVVSILNRCDVEGWRSSYSKGTCNLVVRFCCRVLGCNKDIECRAWSLLTYQILYPDVI